MQEDCKSEDQRALKSRVRREDGDFQEKLNRGCSIEP
jgi:hypothetical protein